MLSHFVKTKILEQQTKESQRPVNNHPRRYNRQRNLDAQLKQHLPKPFPETHHSAYQTIKDKEVGLTIGSPKKKVYHFDRETMEKQFDTRLNKMVAMQKRKDQNSLLSMFDDTARLVDEHIARFKTKREELALPATEEEEDSSNIESELDSVEKEMQSYLQLEIEGEAIGDKKPTEPTVPQSP